LYFSFQVKNFTLKNPTGSVISVEIRTLSSYPVPLEALDILTKWYLLLTQTPLVLSETLVIMVFMYLCTRLIVIVVILHKSTDPENSQRRDEIIIIVLRMMYYFNRSHLLCHVAMVKSQFWLL